MMMIDKCIKYLLIWGFPKTCPPKVMIQEESRIVPLFLSDITDITFLAFWEELHTGQFLHGETNGWFWDPLTHGIQNLELLLCGL